MCIRDRPGPETGLGPPRAVPSTAVSDGALGRLQELVGSGRLCRASQTFESGGGCRCRGPFREAQGVRRRVRG
eukprot:7153684-Alexandrium_andersonii.AAC.1